MQTIEITQELIRDGDRAYTVNMTIDGEPKRFVYRDSNGIYPAFKSLIIQLRKLPGARVVVTTNSKGLAQEYERKAAANGTLLTMLLDTVAEYGIELEIKNEND
ncbi:hypothetical protein M3557_04325 [Bhargavaea ginsengi]|uniref:hypothetical protein n=1 Tax=Bhargavaea ginsengi TaxID=426757 RepID=UPI00203EE673|nr:hypothetical protein [Bhargavaea ginsengi]MCM3087134.1 hypothetical protein [Bhargavaea ginsengi]